MRNFRVYDARRANARSAFFPDNCRLSATGGLSGRLLSLAFGCVLLGVPRMVSATPSTTFFTPATTYTQPFAVPHITYDTYFNGKGGYPIDVGLTLGVLPFEKVQAEVGFDAFLPYKGFFAEPSGPLLLNAKLGIPENAFGPWFPGFSAGMYGFGLTKGTSFNILHGEVSKAFPIGAIVLGVYYGLGGEDSLWRGSDGTIRRAGAMGAVVSPDIVLDLKGLNKINFFADVMTGKNVFGGGGPGVGIYFTPAIDILTGPIFFFDKALQPPFPPAGEGSRMMWTVQLDVDIDFSKAPPPVQAAPATPPPPVAATPPAAAPPASQS